MARVEVKHQLAGADLDAMARLVKAASGGEGHRLLTRDPVTVMAWEPGQPDPVGFAQVAGGGRSGWTLEVITDPHRASSPAVWDRLVATGVDVVGQHGGGRVQLWVHDAGPEHDGRAEVAGLRADRDLYQMRRPLPVDEPVTITTRPFVVGQDEQPWLAVNNRAFAGHPDQGGWALADLARLQEAPWFDPRGFLLHERDGRLVGFCWTKVHAEAEPPLGELYVVAVDPDYQGQGLGRALLVAGLDRLARQGLATALLYVDASNHVAVSLYEALGFTVHHVDRSYTGVVPPTIDPSA